VPCGTMLNGGAAPSTAVHGPWMLSELSSTAVVPQFRLRLPLSAAATRWTPARLPCAMRIHGLPRPQSKV
jgi:hypothetical protein